MLTALIVLALLVVLLPVAGILVLRIQARNCERTIDAYDRLLGKRDAEFKDLLDRTFASKNWAPSGVDLTVRHQERQQREDEANVNRKNGGPLQQRPHRIGALDEATLKMEDTAEELRAKAVADLKKQAEEQRAAQANR